jgi:hypothetical protein
MADDKKNPKEASNIFYSIMKVSVSKPKKAIAEQGSSAQLSANLKEDLLKSTRGNRDEVYLENDYIVVKIPANENFTIAKSILIPLVNASMVSHHANRAAVKITDGKNVEILSWGF